MSGYKDDTIYKKRALVGAFASVACGAACIVAAFSSAPILATAFGLATAGSVATTGYFWMAHAFRNLQHLT